MSNTLLVVIVICIFVVIALVKQINQVTNKIDAKEDENAPSVYANFAAIIQEKLRMIKKDIDHTKNTPEPVYVLNDQNNEEKSLEFLANCIRQLVFFETINSKRKSNKQIELELFEILNSIDEHIKANMHSGEKLANELKDELALKYSQLS